MICSVPAFVLIDSGSTHSFISTQFTSKLAKALELLGFELLVSQPMNRGIICYLVIKNCDICFGDVCQRVNLIPMDMRYFDAILGMDWLSHNAATIDCANKCVIFWKPDAAECCFKREGVTPPPCLVSAARAQKLIRKGGYGILCSIIPSKGEPRVIKYSRSS